ncbi:Flp pilus assembly protein CpaB [Castellaniella caeni]
MTRFLMRLPKTVVLAVLALLIGGLAAGALALHVRDRVRQIEDQSRLAMVERVVAAGDLAAGTRLLPSHLAVRSFPAQWVSRDALPAARYGELEGRLLTANLSAGEAILPVHVHQQHTAFSAQLAPGRRAITLPVDQVNSLSGLLQPGDLIDLYVSFDHQRQRLTAPLLQGVLVLATGRETRTGESGAGEQHYSTVTLDAAPDDVVKLVAARQAGTLTAILRHPEDAQADRRAARGDLAALLGVNPPRTPTPRKAVILYGAASARALPAWARGEVAQPGPGLGLFDLPPGQALSSAWMQALRGRFPASSDAPAPWADGLAAGAALTDGPEEESGDELHEGLLEQPGERP